MQVKIFTTHVVDFITSILIFGKHSYSAMDESVARSVVGLVSDLCIHSRPFNLGFYWCGCWCDFWTALCTICSEVILVLGTVNARKLNFIYILPETRLHFN